jgi:hypothetical protein
MVPIPMNATFILLMTSLLILRHSTALQEAQDQGARALAE